MSDRPVRVYPEHYTPSDLDFDLDLSFEERSGIVHNPPDMQLISGACGTWTLRIENRACDLKPGGVIALVRFNYQIAFNLQTDNPPRRDYCTLETNSSASLKLVTWRDSVNLLNIVVASGVFKKGETCTIRIGDRRQGSVGSEVFWSTTDAEFLLAADVDGTGEFHGVRNNPYRFSVIARPEPDLLRLLGPTVAKVGEPFALHLGVFDQNRNLVESYQRRIQFEIPQGVDGLPPSYRFSPEDRGLKIFENIRIHRPGVYRIGLSGGGVEGRFLSNPAVVSEQPESCVYWGDVHAHGWGDSTMHLMYLRTKKMDPLSRHQQGRRIGRFDFACPASMSMDPTKREEIFGAYREACEQMDEPGRYVPFLAYEAHPRAGDRQVIFKNYKNEPIPPPSRGPMDELVATYGDRDDVFLQVHIGGQPPQWRLYKPVRERFLEVCSGFGCAEWLLQKALNLGYRPGVCAASDLHLGLMGGPRAVEPFRGRFSQKYPMRHRDSAYGTGPVTAIAAAELNREALWSAMEGRQTYATSGARIYLRVTCNGIPSGAEIDLTDELQVAIVCHACAPLDRIDLIVGDYCLKSWHPDGMDFAQNITFSAADLPGDWVYVRVHQTDNEYAWSSPVYLERQGPFTPPGDLPRWNEQEEIDLDAIGENDASSYLPDLQHYLKLEEDPERFQKLSPIGVVEQFVGRCALFYCYWGEEKLRMSIRWFFEFEIPRIRYDFGWQDFGAFDENDLGAELMDKYGT